MASLKVEICLKKKTTPSTNIPLLSLRKSEQQSSVLKSVILAVLDIGWLLIKTNTFKMNTFYRNNICDLGWEKKIVHTITQAFLV